MKVKAALMCLLLAGTLAISVKLSKVQAQAAKRETTIAQAVEKLREAPITSIVVTHDVHESLAIVDYVYFLAEGSIVAHGTPDELNGRLK